MYQIYKKYGIYLFSIFVLLIVVISYTVGCSYRDNQQSGSYWPTRGWKSVLPENEGMDSQKLDEMIEFIQSSRKKINGLVVVRNGRIVKEAYFNTYNEKTLGRIASCTKSFISALVGIAINEGYIKSIDDKVLGYFPDYKFDNVDNKKRDMTVKNLLTMTTGIEWNDNNTIGYENNDINRMKQTDDSVRYVLSRPMRDQPGTSFNYCSGASMVLSAIITKSTGKSTLSYARSKLFRPLGITSIEWYKDKAGIYDGQAGLKLTVRDMAKFGYLYLKNGEWDGKQIIPESWIKESTRKHIDTPINIYGEGGYGYQWWMNKGEEYSARGAGGQFIFIIPEKELVIVFASELPENEFFLPERLVEEYVFKAITGE